MDTRAEIAKIKFPVGKNQPPTCGPTMRLGTSEYIAKPTCERHDDGQRRKEVDGLPSSSPAA